MKIDFKNVPFFDDNAIAYESKIRCNNSADNDRKFVLIVYWCTDINCIECGEYNKAQKKGECTKCKDGYKLNE